MVHRKCPAAHMIRRPQSLKAASRSCGGILISQAPLTLRTASSTWKLYPSAVLILVLSPPSSSRTFWCSSLAAMASNSSSPTRAWRTWAAQWAAQLFPGPCLWAAMRKPPGPPIGYILSPSCCNRLRLAWSCSFGVDPPCFVSFTWSTEDPAPPDRMVMA